MGPDDYAIEWDGENIVTTVDDLLTDTTKLESYATGKKPNIKKLLKSEQKKKYVNKLNKSFKNFYSTFIKLLYKFALDSS